MIILRRQFCKVQLFINHKVKICIYSLFTLLNYKDRNMDKKISQKSQEYQVLKKKINKIKNYHNMI